MKFHFITAVWGEPYLTQFLKIILPNHLTPGNLGAFSKLSKCRYRIFSRRSDIARIASSECIAHLKTLIPLDIIEVPNLGEKVTAHDVYNDMTRCHLQGVMDADREKAAVVFLPADSIWSEGSFSALKIHYENKKTAVMLPGIRLCSDPFSELFLERFYNSASGYSIAPARELAAAALPHLHPLMLASQVCSKHFITWPSHLIWPVSDDGFVIRGFHLHPFMINPQVRGVKFKYSLDYDYLAKACPDLARIHVATDSDEILQVAIERNKHREELISEQAYRFETVTSWAGEFTDPHHRWLFTEHKIRVHSSDIIPEQWLPAEACSDKIAERIRVIYKF